MPKKKEQLQMLIRQQQEIMGTARSEGRVLSGEETERMESLQREITELGEKMEGETGEQQP